MGRKMNRKCKSSSRQQTQRPRPCGKNWKLFLFLWTLLATVLPLCPWTLTPVMPQPSGSLLTWTKLGQPRNWRNGQSRWELTSLSTTVSPAPKVFSDSPRLQSACVRFDTDQNESPAAGVDVAPVEPPARCRIDRVFARPPQQPQPAKWALKVETVNSSNWGPAKSWLSMTDASVVLLQEHHLSPDRCVEARAWCQKRGWKALFSPALPGSKDDHRSWTAGVAILVREALGLARWTAGLQELAPQTSDDGIVPGRLVAGIVTLLDGVAIAVASGYWFSGQGLKECNLRLFSAVCQLAQATTLDIVVGGDFQSEPVLAQELDCFALAGLVLKTASRDKTTCTSKFGGRCIDWFLMSSSLGAAVDQIEVRKEAFTRPHSPVCVLFKPRLSLLKNLVMDAPKKLPLEPMVGPLGPLPSARAAEKAVRIAVHATWNDPSWTKADQALAEAYRASARLW